jgi:predicted metal-binding membrane protein
MEEGLLAFVLTRNRVIVLFALAVITVLAWAYLWSLSRDMAVVMTAPMTSMPGMQEMPGMLMPAAMAPGFAPWSWQHALVQFAMWSVMMVGMMTPSVAPAVLIYSRVADQASRAGAQFAPPICFATGYLISWTLFAAVATAAQWGLERGALLTPMLVSANRAMGGGILLAAGAYQWTSLKDSCLAHCRAPLSFIQRHGGFKPGVRASVRLGFVHGLTCIGCCWALMALLFVAGVMNLLWIAAIMFLVLVEKIVPYGRTVARTAGAAAIVVGACMLVYR